MESRVCILLTLNCGLSIAHWFFTKAMVPVVVYLRRLGHRVFAYLDHFFCVEKPCRPNEPTETAEMRPLGRLMPLPFEKLGLSLKLAKCELDGTTRWDIIDILVYTMEEKFLLQPQKTTKIEATANHLLRYGSCHHRFFLRKDEQKFASLAKESAPAFVDCHLQLKELFNCIYPPAE